MVFCGVELRGEVIALGLSLLAGQGGVFVALVHVVGDGPHVVEELGIHGPALIFLPDGVSDDPALALLHCIAQQETLAFEQAVAQPFVRCAVFVHRFSGAGEPTLVDPSAMHAQGIPVIRVQLDPFARLQEAARHPRGREPQQSSPGVHGTIQNPTHIVRLDDWRGTHGR